jgi:hypothetical protein
MNNQRIDLVEGLTPSEAVKEAAHRVRVGNVGTTTTRDNFVPNFGKEKFWMLLTHLDLFAT